jgi:hypothetical protein
MTKRSIVLTTTALVCLGAALSLQITLYKPQSLPSSAAESHAPRIEASGGASAQTAKDEPEARAADTVGKSIRELETEIRAMGYVERMNFGLATAEERSRFATVAQELTLLRAKKIAEEIAGIQAEIREQVNAFNQE